MANDCAHDCPRINNKVDIQDNKEKNGKKATPGGNTSKDRKKTSKANPK